MNEIIEEHLKDMLWVSLTIIVGILVINAVDIISRGCLVNVSRGILLILEKYADLSAEYGGEFTISIPSLSLFNYSIMLDEEEYSFLIQGICVFTCKSKYKFNRIIVKSGKTYFIRKFADRVLVVER